MRDLITIIISQNVTAFLLFLALRALMSKNDTRMITAYEGNTKVLNLVVHHLTFTEIPTSDALIKKSKREQETNRLPPQGGV